MSAIINTKASLYNTSTFLCQPCKPLAEIRTTIGLSGIHKDFFDASTLRQPVNL